MKKFFAKILLAILPIIEWYFKTTTKITYFLIDHPTVYKIVKISLKLIVFLLRYLLLILGIYLISKKFSLEMELPFDYILNLASMSAIISWLTQFLLIDAYEDE